MPLAIYALARGNSPTNHDGWASPTVIGCFAVAAVALAYFVRTELRSPAPLLQLRLLGERNFGVSMAVLTLFSIGMLGGTYLLPLYMQRGLGYTALMAGSVFLPVGLIQGVRPYRVTSRAMSNPCCSRRRASCCWRRAFGWPAVSRSTPPTGTSSSCSTSAGWAWGSRSPR